MRKRSDTFWWVCKLNCHTKQRIIYHMFMVLRDFKFDASAKKKNRLLINNTFMNVTWDVFISLKQNSCGMKQVDEGAKVLYRNLNTAAKSTYT